MFTYGRHCTEPHFRRVTFVYDRARTFGRGTQFAVGQFAVKKNVSFGYVILSLVRLGLVRSNNIKLG